MRKGDFPRSTMAAGYSAAMIPAIVLRANAVVLYCGIKLAVLNTRADADHIGGRATPFIVSDDVAYVHRVMAGISETVESQARSAPGQFEDICPPSVGLQMVGPGNHVALIEAGLERAIKVRKGSVDLWNSENLRAHYHCAGIRRILNKLPLAGGIVPVRQAGIETEIFRQLGNLLRRRWQPMEPVPDADGQPHSDDAGGDVKVARRSFRRQS